MDVRSSFLSSVREGDPPVRSHLPRPPPSACDHVAEAKEQMLDRGSSELHSERLFLSSLPSLLFSSSPPSASARNLLAPLPLRSRASLSTSDEETAAVEPRQRRGKVDVALIWQVNLQGIYPGCCGC